MVASGTFGYGEEFEELIDVNRLGALVVKSITREPRPGNRTPRSCESPSGMLNSIGLENKGLQGFLKELYPRISEKFRCPLVVNIAGADEDEYVELAEAIGALPKVAALEINISCPNIREGGMSFGVSAQLTGALVKRLRRATKVPLIVKLSPNVTDPVVVAQGALDAGADILSLVNTVLALSIDWRKRRSRIAGFTGGLSGPAIRPIAVRMVWQVKKRFPKVPVIGIGGIVNADDVLEFMVAGASAVQVGTANFVEPTVTMEILDRLPGILAAEGVHRIEELVGTVRGSEEAQVPQVNA